MPKLTLEDTTRTGKQAEKLRHLIVGQEDAIYLIVRAYQTYLADERKE